MPAWLPPIPTPTSEQVQKYLARWEEGDNEKIDAALRATFEAMPKNDDVGEVAVKIAALNGLYGTNILGVLRVARHIVSLDIDAMLDEHTMHADLIEKIAKVEFDGKRRRNYSFATKYCSFHRPEVYPIYDSLVVGILHALLKQGEEFDAGVRVENWRVDYALWHRSITRFRAYYDLEEFSLRDVDKYLWSLAKERNLMNVSQASYP
jgi:hypothetical protein